MCSQSLNKDVTKKISLNKIKGLRFIKNDRDSYKCINVKFNHCFLLSS